MCIRDSKKSVTTLGPIVNSQRGASATCTLTYMRSGRVAAGRDERGLLVIYNHGPILAHLPMIGQHGLGRAGLHERRAVEIGHHRLAEEQLGLAVGVDRQATVEQIEDVEPMVNPVALAKRGLEARIGEYLELAATRLDFPKIGLQLVEPQIVGGDGNHRHVGIDQRQRAALEFAGEVGFGMDVGDFLELQRAFQGDRVGRSLSLIHI